MHKGRVKANQLLITSVDIKKAISEQKDPYTSDEYDIETKSYDLTGLAQKFSVIETNDGNSELMVLSPMPMQKSVQERLYILDVELSDIFDKVSGYVEISTLSVGYPLGLVLGNDAEKKMDVFTDKLLTQAIDHGNSSVQGEITVDYKGWLPKEDSQNTQQTVEVKTSLVVPSIVDHIKDKGVYREVHLTNREPLYTATPKATLEKTFGLG